MSFKPVFIMPDGERASNAQRFETRAEAIASARARFMRWTMPADYDAEQSGDPINYKYQDGDIAI